MRPNEIHSCYVCTNTGCAEWGSGALLASLKEQLADTEVQVKTHICFGACWMGPNIVLYPQGTWYSDVKPEDLGEIVAHVRGGSPVERLMRQTDVQLVELTLSLLEAGLE